MNVLIAGASGLVGRYLLSYLSANSRVETIYSFGRTPPDREQAKVIFQKVDFSDLPSFPTADVAFCALGTTLKTAGSQEQFIKIDHDYVIHFAKACAKAGVKTFAYVSAQGANPDSRIFYSRVKGQIEKHLEELNFAELIIIRPSLLLGERQEKRAFEELAQSLGRLFRPLMIGPLKMGRPVKAAQVAGKLIETALARDSSQAARQNVIYLSNSQI